MPHSGMSSLGVEEGFVAAGSYLVVLGPLVLVLERKSAFVKFHALQSTLSFAVLLGFYLAVKYLNLYYISWAPGLMCLFFAIFMMMKAYYGEEYKLPGIGSLAYHAVYDCSDDLLAEDEE